MNLVQELNRIITTVFDNEEDFMEKVGYIATKGYRGELEDFYMADEVSCIIINDGTTHPQIYTVKTQDVLDWVDSL